jgi:two-component system, cell cycle sensor histidine kinase and response regulator CckA
VRLELKSLTLAPDETPPAPEMAPGDWICLVVTDSGPGIPPEVLPRIFEPFFTTKPPAESTGLGLSQVYGIMRQHGGHITVTSRPEEGTQFTLYWPPLPSTGPPDSPASGPKAKRPASPRPGLLLIEDDPVLHQVLADMFSEEGYRVFVAGNGRDAWRHFEEHESAIGLALIDVALPDMSGLDLYHLLRERAPQLPVILMSGYPITLEAQALLEYGQLDWLQKPFTTDELLRRVEEYYP